MSLDGLPKKNQKETKNSSQLDATRPPRIHSSKTHGSEDVGHEPQSEEEELAEVLGAVFSVDPGDSVRVGAMKAGLQRKSEVEIKEKNETG